jgi:hypothetical protein
MISNKNKSGDLMKTLCCQLFSKSFKSFLIALPVISIASCSLIFETDISDDEVYINAPVDSLNTTNNFITFWWDYVPEAEKYNLQIVSPSWNSINTLIVDTNLTENKFSISISPGEYDWGVSAYNNSSSTGYTVYHLVIDTSSSLTNQSVVIKSPEENYSTNITLVPFSWYKLDAASSYLFEIRKDSWTGANVVPTQIITTENYSLTLSEGVYYWGVQGRNDFSSTSFNPRELIIDLTAPGKPIITNPSKYGDTLKSDNLKIIWTHPLESLSEISDSLIISKDSLFTPEGIENYFVTKLMEMTLDGYSNGKYFCKVRSFDEAGNIGIVSEVKKFYINEE